MKKERGGEISAVPNSVPKSSLLYYSNLRENKDEVNWSEAALEEPSEKHRRQRITQSEIIAHPISVTLMRTSTGEKIK